MKREAPAERVEIRQSSGIEFGVNGSGELGFAGTIMSERQQSNDSAARLLFAVTGQQRFEGTPVAAREELVTIDQIEQSHWLAAQGMDDVPVIDHVAMLSAGMRPLAAQRRQRRRAEEAFEPVVVKPHAKPVADQARRHRIEHLLEDEPAGRGNGDDGLLVIRRPARRQRLQGRALETSRLRLRALRRPTTSSTKRR